jgi:hypothetical protein
MPSLTQVTHKATQQTREKSLNWLLEIVVK